MQGMNDSKEKPELFLTEQKKTSPKSHKFSVVPALLSRLWWLSSSPLIITYSQGLKQDVLQRVVGISVCCTRLQELCGYWEIWEAAEGWELPGSLWPAVTSFDGSLLLVDSGSLLWDTHIVLVVVFLFAFNFLWSAASWRTGKASILSLWQVMPQDIFHNWPCRIRKVWLCLLGSTWSLPAPLLRTPFNQGGVGA